MVGPLPLVTASVPSWWRGSSAAACTCVLTTATCSKCQHGWPQTDGTLTAALLCRSAAACRAAAATGEPRQSACHQCRSCPLLIRGWPIIVTVTLCMPCIPWPPFATAVWRLWPHQQSHRAQSLSDSCAILLLHAFHLYIAPSTDAELLPPQAACLGSLFKLPSSM